MDAPLKGGGTLRQHYEAVERQGVRVPELSDVPPMPKTVAYLWRWFHELSSCRTSNGFSWNPLTYQEMDAWARLTGREVEPWEVQLLKTLDRMFLLAMVQPKETK